MTAVYGVAVVVGLLALLLWAGFGVAATAVDGWQGIDPETRFGARGRGLVAAVTGFGMGGMSATFADWGAGLAVAAAIGGAVGMAFVATRLGPRDETQ